MTLAGTNKQRSDASVMEVNPCGPSYFLVVNLCALLDILHVELPQQAP